MIRKRIGILVPSSNTVLEADFYKNVSEDITVHSSRMYLEETTVIGEEKMLDNYFPRALSDIVTAKPDIVVFGCTSAGALRGNEYDAETCRKIASAARCATVSVIKAVREKIAALNINNLLVLTPYVHQLNMRIKASLEADSINVASIKGLGISDNFEIGMVAPEEIEKFIKSEIKTGNYDSVFLSCTNFRAMEAYKTLQQTLGIPIVTSNQAAVEKAIDILKTT